MSAKWIWYSGDYEVYHSMLLHARRTEYDFAFGPMWHVSRPEMSAYFSKNITVDAPVTAKAVSKGFGYVKLDERRICALNEEFTIPAGSYRLVVNVTNLETFPSCFIEALGIETDETWTGHFNEAHPKPVGCNDAFTCADQDPAVFPFSYKPIEIASANEVDGGMLYDFGQESFGPVYVTAEKSAGTVSVYYGESEPEALSMKYSYLREHIPAFDGEKKLMSRAFRYIYVRTENAGSVPAIRAELEYLPLEDLFAFTSDDARLPEILKICSNAFHLNSREFFLDGIKRDRWVWSGDAYQSYQVSRYLFNDPDITRRTIRALLGKLPVLQHTNTINDYSAYMFLGAWDYFYASGDIKFIADIWENLVGLYDFIVSRLDPETGYVVKQEDDWIFIDWADIDKDGPLAAEQILLYNVYTTMDKLTAALNENGYAALAARVSPMVNKLAGAGETYSEKAETLKARIMKDFWREERGGFIDTYASGREHMTRHANIFAILFDFVPDDVKEVITQSVLLNDDIDQITTPYFKLYELMAFARMGRMEVIQDYIDSYWGGMIKNGATSAWEEFDPNKEGIEHYAMYGEPFGCSLCHAWGAGPILLLGKYCAGVKETSVGAKTFEVAPVPGRYTHFEAAVPMAGGVVNVNYADGKVTVSASIPGGTLKWNGREAEIPVNQFVTL